MAVSNLPTFPQGGPQAWALQLINATGTAITQVMAGGANGSIIEAINVAQTDVANALLVYLNDGTTNHLIGCVEIAATAGGNVSTGATPSVDLLRSGQIVGIPADVNGNLVLYVPSGWSLKVAANAAVTAAKTMDIVAMGANY